jgi:hypothetical protein
VFDFAPLKLIPTEQDGAIQTAVWSFIKASHQDFQLPETLYHYTDAAGLKGIIESGAIRATHVAYMNDASEYLHAVHRSDCRNSSDRERPAADEPAE